ncbi:MAG TPA: polyphosphate:AMP phosphotransferase, partial [bacterium]|nr:polyphosphate:AMP phosphotransferase [bacterium]
MFEAAEIGNKIDKQTYQHEEPRVREALLQVQRRLADSKHSVIIIVGGVEGAGKSETVNLLLEWMDARGIEVHAFGAPTDEERERPRYWRYWRLLPPHGKIGVFFGSWYTDPIVNRTYGKTDDAQLQLELHRITQFERMLHNEGVVLVKIWMHLAKDVQEKRLKSLHKDPATRWRITPLTWKYFKKYDDFRKVSEESLRHTSLGFAPWHVVEAADARYRNLTVASLVLRSIEAALDA